MHCAKCHSASADAPQGDNWKSVPNINSCAGCHGEAFFDPPSNHGAPAMPAMGRNSQCANCHGPASNINFCGPNGNQSCRIEAVHTTVNPTTNNPSVPTGAAIIEYEIDEVTVDATTRQASIRFRVLRDGMSMMLNPPPADLSGGPSFLLAYALPQDGVDEPLDYNNLGLTAGQPTSVSVANLANGTAGTLTGPDANGFFTAVTNYAFPVGSMMRAVSLQGYWSQNNVNGVTGNNIPRHAISVVETAVGDDARREIVDSAKCANCHEWFEAHGGNRVYEVQNCVMCHNPNLSSSGRTTNPTLVTAAKAAEMEDVLAGNGRLPTNPLRPGPVVGTDPLTWPEESQNLRELIHGIHASSMRSNDFAFVRLRGSNITPYNFAHVTYPNEPNRCEACHMPGTYDTNLPVGELAGTRIIPSTTPDSRDALLAARASVPNATDIVTSPGAAACGSCHDNPAAINHMKLTGAYVDGPRSGLIDGNLESCNVCHGTGRSADAAVAHGN
ncbi:MAG: OmcA/MtrC family decaheme c-type cytochrome [Myxococcales bacterium]|nr:OmcA/MtrC family decaheme c-type cytochrome [Myxococcales bacterium]